MATWNLCNLFFQILLFFSDLHGVPGICWFYSTSSGPTPSTRSILVWCGGVDLWNHSLRIQRESASLAYSLPIHRFTWRTPCVPFESRGIVHCPRPHELHYKNALTLANPLCKPVDGNEKKRLIERSYWMAIGAIFLQRYFSWDIFAKGKNVFHLGFGLR